MAYFVIQKKHASANDTWTNTIHTKDTLNAARHQFHAFMSTYGYEQDATLDYVACSVETMDGRVIVGPEVDDRIVVPEPEPEPAELEPD